MTEVVDAVVIGAGPNGLACANHLADAGWSVLVLEAEPSAGGAVASAGYLGPGFVADVASAFYPLAAVSPALAGLRLEDHGLRWRRASVVLAHPLPDGRAALLYPDRTRTATGLDRLGAGDGAAWRALCERWDRVGGPLLEAMLGPFPPLRAGGRLAVTLGPSGLLRLARDLVLPVRRLGEETFSGPGGRLLLAGCTLHTDLSPESATGGLFGWVLAMLGQQVGFPVPEGGAGRLADALVDRLTRRGGRLRYDSPVGRVLVDGGRATGVVTGTGDIVLARRAVVAAVPATALYGGLVPWADLPDGLRRDLDHFEWDHGTVKVDWALRGPIPWRAPEVAGAGTVHVADDLDEMTRYSADLATGRVPARPFLVLGQMTAADPSRAPAGHHVAWAYTHVPRVIRGDAGPDGITGAWDEADRRAILARIEARIEALAPGFGRLITTRRLLSPDDLAAHDRSLVGGALGGGTGALHQQLLFRPAPGLGRPETPLRHLYLASSSAHPGGGVHGAGGANAARAARAAEGPLGRLLTGPVVRGAGRLARGY
ncbi:MAG TPA: NAD(P)/FAD-dependent oxidoreductase [Acidimicrobiales bacterium]|nr:NAD(P)/FAD-dependent oxidoreductase [Acidimicrobiales bacterium]